jgi:hypothetical protein
VEEGQNQLAAVPEAQVVRALIEPALKNSPLEALSMKLSLYVLLLKTVVKSPVDGLAGYIVTPEDELFDCVSIPKIRSPLTEDTPPRGITGKSNITPLLSVGRNETGF